MKRKHHTIIIAAFLASATSALAEPPVAQAGGKETPVATSKEWSIQQASAVKHFCVAMRRSNHAAMRELLDPEYLKRHGIAEDEAVVFNTAPLVGIYTLEPGLDQSTVLCLYETADGDKEAMILGVRTEGSEVYITPVTPPSPVDGKITPWMHQTSLEEFIKR